MNRVLCAEYLETTHCKKFSNEVLYPNNEFPELPREMTDDSIAKGIEEPETSHFAKKRALQN